MLKQAERYRSSIAQTRHDRQALLELRDLVYVNQEGRLASTNSHFDSYDENADYLLTWQGDQLVGTIRIIRDSEKGLPCETVTSIESLRVEGGVVELGHFITAPGKRSPALVCRMVRDAVSHASLILKARFLIADMFYDISKSSMDKHFYFQLGAESLHGPYQDHRFLAAPWSLIGYLDTAQLQLNASAGKGLQKRLCHYISGGIPA